MRHNWKSHLALFVFALCLALTGLFAQPPSAYAGTGLHPPRPRYEPATPHSVESALIFDGSGLTPPGRP